MLVTIKLTGLLLLLSILLQALEKYLMTKLHERTFRQAPDDVERDELLAVRCAGLGFVQPHHLEVPDGIADEGCLARAAAELNRMNSFKVCGGRGKPKWRMCVLLWLDTWMFALCIHVCSVVAGSC
jgi:hypothetical protein